MGFRRYSAIEMKMEYIEIEDIEIEYIEIEMKMEYIYIDKQNYYKINMNRNLSFEKYEYMEFREYRRIEIKFKWIYLDKWRWLESLNEEETQF